MAQLTDEQTFQIAVQHHQSGRLPQAEQLYRQILAKQPNHAQAMHLLGVIAAQGGRNDVAVDLIRRAISIKPNWAQALGNLGNALKDQGKFDEAIDVYRKAIALTSNQPDTHYNLGNALREKGNLSEAVGCYRQALALKPNWPQAHSNLGEALRILGQVDEAIAACRTAISLQPNYAQAHYNLGVALKDKGQIDDAIAAYRQAIALKPDWIDAHYNLGNALKENGKLDEAIAMYRRAIALSPGFSEAYGNLAGGLKDTGRCDEGIAAYRQAIAVKPDFPEAHSNLVLAMHYHPAYDAQAIAEELRRWNRQHAAPLEKFIQPHGNDRSPDRLLRIGYVSPDFRDHAVGRNLLPLFNNHDLLQFEITCYAHVARPDALTAQFQRNSGRWRNIGGVTDEQVADQIRHDQIDILVDLALHTASGRLLVFARKPAPVQATFAGYPGSTGLTTIDYRLSDPYLDPPGMDESIYSEKTVRLPDSFWCYDPLEGREVPVNPVPAMATGVVTFGCLNNFCKVNEVILALWAQVLGGVPGSRLLLLAGQGSHRQRTVEFLARQGVEPSRVEFLDPQPRRQYLEMYHRIDVGLDSFPYNGHTTSLDSFWMGVPVVTLVGQTAVSRAGWCQLSNLGLTGLAGVTPEQFVRIATKLVCDLPRLGKLRSTLRQRMEKSPLMNAPRFARNIEAAYRRMWRTYTDAST